MTTPSPFSFANPEYEAQAKQTVIAIAESLGRTICIARSLIENGRVVDLAGLDRGVGLLCAKALDLPIEVGRELRPHLISVLAEADALTASLHAQEKR